MKRKKRTDGADERDRRVATENVREQAKRKAEQARHADSGERSQNRERNERET